MFFILASHCNCSNIEHKYLSDSVQQRYNEQVYLINNGRAHKIILLSKLFLFINYILFYFIFHFNENFLRNANSDMSNVLCVKLNYASDLILFHVKNWQNIVNAKFYFYFTFWKRKLCFFCNTFCEGSFWCQLILILDCFDQGLMYLSMVSY
jgi:hypothetical protein